MRYTIRQLQYFVAAAESGSITLGSEKINISQPSISAAISTLEREFGVQLFIRHHAQGLSLTAAGRRLLVEAKQLIQQAQSLYAVASEAADKVSGALSVGCMVTMAPMVMPELAHGFIAAYPRATIRQTAANLEWLLQALERAEIDVALTYDMRIPDGIAFTPLTQLPPYVMVGENSPLAGRESVSLGELASLPLILLDLPLSAEYFLGLFLKEGLTPLIHSRSNHQEVVRTMVANGYGYTLANVRPRSDLALDGRRLIRLSLSGTHRPMIIGAAVLSQVRPTRLLSAFVAHCQSAISDAHIPGMMPVN